MLTIDANGARIPAIGLGTWQLGGRSCARIVEQALRLGYRHVDTAQMYDNEREVGEGLRASGIRRDDAFITTKVWTTHFAPRDLERSVKESLVKLRMSDIDLVLLHWPNPRVPLAETLGGLARVRQAGMARHIGVSNFSPDLVAEAVRLCAEPLVCNQIECHPYVDQRAWIAANNQVGLATVAYSPIAKGRVRDDDTLKRIGAQYGKSEAQVCLRWLVQQNISAIPRTSRVERLSENIAVFDFELSDAHMAAISALSHVRDHPV